MSCKATDQWGVPVFFVEDFPLFSLLRWYVWWTKFNQLGWCRILSMNSIIGLQIVHVRRWHCFWSSWNLTSKKRVEYALSQCTEEQNGVTPSAEAAKWEFTLNLRKHPAFIFKLLLHILELLVQCISSKCSCNLSWSRVAKFFVHSIIDSLFRTHCFAVESEWA